MDEPTLTSQLLGPTGGIFALGMIAGALLMWRANLKMVAPYVERAHAAEMKTMSIRIEMLEEAVKHLRVTEGEYLKLLHSHSAATLHPRETS